MPDGGSFRDPDGRVFQLDGEIFRATDRRGSRPTCRRSRRAGCSGGWWSPATGRDHDRQPGALGAVCAPKTRGPVGRLRYPARTLPFVFVPLRVDLLDAEGRGAPAAAVTPRGTGRRVSRQGRDAVQRAVARRRARCSSTSARSSERAAGSRGGYRQFCMLFLYPLLLESYRGIPLPALVARAARGGSHPSEARALLRGSDPRGGVLKHVALHASSSTSHADGTRSYGASCATPGFEGADRGRTLEGPGEALEGARGPSPGRPNGAKYGVRPAATPTRTRGKEDFVRAAAHREAAAHVWVSRRERRAVLPHRRRRAADYTIALDVDHGVVERRTARREEDAQYDSSPRRGHRGPVTGALGWRGRASACTLAELGRPDLVLALALVHHLIIGARTIPHAGARRLVRRARQRARRRVPRPRGCDGQAAARAQARRLASRLQPNRLRGVASQPFAIVARTELPSGTQRSTTRRRSRCSSLRIGWRLRAPHRAVGLRGHSAGVLDAEGEPRVSHRAWVNSVGDRGVRWWSRSSHRLSPWPLRL